MTRKTKNAQTQSYFEQLDVLIRAEAEAEREAMASAMDARGTDYLDANDAIDDAIAELDKIFG
jgi:hypothetical protein